MPTIRKVKSTKKPNYLSATQLKITERVRKYLVYAAETLPLLNKPRKLNGGTFGFNMRCILRHSTKFGNAQDFEGRECGTAGCIMGLMLYKAELDGDEQAYKEIENCAGGMFERRGMFVNQGLRLYPLFYPPTVPLDSVNNKVATNAVVHFLKTGKIKFEGSYEDRN